MKTDLIGNIIAFISLLIGTIYQLIFNVRRYNKNISDGMDKLEAIGAKTHRNHMTIALMFIGLAISYIIIIIGDFYG